MILIFWICVTMLSINCFWNRKYCSMVQWIFNDLKMAVDILYPSVTLHLTGGTDGWRNYNDTRGDTGS